MVAVRPAIESVPVRGVPPLAVTDALTMPGPEPEAPDVMMSQASVVAAVQARRRRHGDRPGSAAANTDGFDVGLIANEHPLAWLTVTVRSAMVILLARDGPPLAATENCTVPLPLPLEPLVTVSQLAPAVAVQEQLAAALTAIAGPLPPPAPTEAVSGATVNVQPAVWLTVTVRPATVTVPVRVAPPFASTAIVTVPLPEPEGPV